MTTKPHTILVRILLLLITGLLALAAWPQDDELLEPDQAFSMQEPVIGPDSITLNWKIAPDYYLYRDKFRFELVGDGVELDTPILPPAIRKNDEFFGEVDIYKKHVTVELPLKRREGSARDVTLKTAVQGCNEPVGVCYPPIRKSLQLTLPASEITDDATPAGPVPGSPLPSTNSRQQLDSLLGQADDEFLPPDQAFAFSAVATAADTIHVSILVADRYYLYRSKFSFDSASEGVKILPYTLPAGEVKEDQFLGRQEVYHGEFDIDLKLSGRPRDGKFDLVAKYQGCAEAGICYPPITKQVRLDLPEDVADRATPGTSTPVTTRTGQAAPAPAATNELSEEEGIIAILSGGSTWATIVAFFLFGLALSLTPCVFPMIPILSGIIVGQGVDVTRLRAFLLSVAYVLGMAIMYTIAGILAGMTGELLSSAFQNPWVLSVFAFIFVLLALSMFGFYDLQLPTRLQSKLSETSNQVRGGAYGGVFVMGMLSALIVGPCVAAPLSGALLYIGQTGDVVLGGTALFVMSLGMGVPLLLIGASAGTLLPKAGTWMNAVKAVFGVLLLAVAIWLLERILPAPATMLLWALLLIVSATYMNALDSLPAHASGWHRLWKGLGIVMVLYGAALFAGALTGASNPLNPLEKFTASPMATATMPGMTDQGELAFRHVKGPDELQTALSEAAAAGKPVMIDFYADWCVECVRMENTTFKSPAVHRALADFMLLRLDVTANDDADKAVLKQFKLFGPPALLFFDTEGQEIRSLRVVGYMDDKAFLDTVQKIDRQ